MAPSDTRKCDASLRIDVDLMILEYLLYSTTRALLEYHGQDQQGHPQSVEVPSELNNQLYMVDAFLRVFHHNHPRYSLLPSCTFHVCLSKFTTLYTLRHIHNFSTPSHHALIELRFGNRRRAVYWRKTLGYGSFPHVLLGEATGESIEHDAEGKGPLAGLPSLLDLLPDFILLTAARTFAAADSKRGYTSKAPIKVPANDGANPKSDQARRAETDWTPTRQWLELAAEMMLQACLEQFLELDNHSLSTILESFAWGPGPWFDPDDENISATTKCAHSENAHGGIDTRISDATPRNRPTRQQDHEATRLNATFGLADEDTETSDLDRSSDDEQSNDPSPRNSPPQPNSSPIAKTWRSIRHTYITEICTPLQSHRKDEMLPLLKALQSRHPRSAFDKHMHLFLSSVLGSHQPPVLVQLTTRGVNVEVDGVQMCAEESATLRRLAGLP